MNRRIFSRLRVTTDRKAHQRIFLTHDGTNISHLPKLVLGDAIYIYQHVAPTVWDYFKYRSSCKCIRDAGNIAVLVDRKDPLLYKHMQKIHTIITNSTNMVYSNIVDISNVKITKDLIKLLLWDRLGTCIGKIYIMANVDIATRKVSIRYYCEKNNHKCFKFILNTRK